jgi:inositol phosphorylceramide mannosyltransferase catalytic subunit
VLCRIPKRIIQTGRDANLSLPKRAMVSNLRLLNPDYEYMFFDDARVESFFDLEFPEYRSVFDSFQFPIQRYDFFRYLAVFRYGGFYFDLDVLLAAGLSSLCESRCVFPFEGPTLSDHLRDKHQMDWEIGNYAFGAEAQHPFLKAVIENCLRAQRDPAWVKPMMRGYPPILKAEYLILNTTGPGLLSRTLAENPELAEDVTVLFQEDLNDAATWNRFGDLGIHLMDGSWRTKSGFLRRKLAQYWELWKMRRLAERKLRPAQSSSRGITTKSAVVGRQTASNKVGPPGISNPTETDGTVRPEERDAL